MDSAIYALVLDSLNRRGGGLPIANTYSALQIRGSAFIPGGLRSRLKEDTVAFQALAAATVRDRPSLPEVLVAWRERPWFDRDTIIGKRDRNGNAIIHFIVGLSPIGFSPDSTRAALLIETVCGGLCGGADIIVVERVGPSWRIRGIHEYFVR